jgi:probable HAF family extracellular repeat protein
MLRTTWFALAALAVTLHAAPESTQAQQYTITDLGSLYGCCTIDDESNAAGVNNAGDVVGWSLTQLGTLIDNPVAVTVPLAINASGVVVGYADGATSQRAFAYSNGVMRDLGVLAGPEGFPGWEYSLALAINTAGDVVGESTGAAFLYHDGAMVNLNDRIAHDEGGWPRFHAATGINDRGQIVGQAYFGDRPGLRACLLTPVPAVAPQ